jgi:hypothetical protein
VKLKDLHFFFEKINVIKILDTLEERVSPNQKHTVPLRRFKTLINIMASPGKAST